MAKQINKGLKNGFENECNFVLAAESPAIANSPRFVPHSGLFGAIRFKNHGLCNQKPTSLNIWLNLQSLYLAFCKTL